MIPLLLLAITMTPERSEVPAGEPVIVHGSIALPEGATLAPPGQDALKGTPFELFGIKIKEGGIFEVHAAAFDAGEQMLPALEFRVTGPDGKETKVKSPPVKLKITAPAADEPGADIRELRDAIRPPNWLWPILAVLAAILAALALKFRPKPEAPEREPRERPDLSPYDAALERLGRLADSGLWERGAVKEFYIELGDILRDYLEARYGLQSRTLTTSALIRQMRQLEIDAGVCREARAFFDDCDLAKFARWKPETLVKDHDVQRLRGLLDATRPQAEASRV